MTSSPPTPVSLEEIAYDAMIERGFLPDFTASELQELPSVAPIRLDGSLKDQRHLPWISIDNEDSKDLDQLTFAEPVSADRERVYVAIADVATLVHKGSAVDRHASHNTTSVYTPTRLFPMLPPRLSTDMTSLHQGVDRLAVVVVMEVGPEGSFELTDLYPAWVNNHAKLVYNGVNHWLDHATSLDHPKGGPLIGEQLRLQDRLAQRLENDRYRQGALRFAPYEVQPVVTGGRVTGLRPRGDSRAHGLIENIMIACNVAVTRFMTEERLPTLRRVVTAPKRWDRIEAIAKERGETLPSLPDARALQAFLARQHRVDPKRFPDLCLALIKLIGKGQYVVGLPGEPSPGHFDLALFDYAHTTAPNRRYPDLVMQRLLKNHFEGQPVRYEPEELKAVAERCSQKESDAAKVERHLRKSAVATVFASQLGQEFSAIVTGASPKGTWVRLVEPSVEGRLIQGYQGIDVGDEIRVKLLEVDVLQGHLDFGRV